MYAPRPWARFRARLGQTRGSIPKLQCFEEWLAAHYPKRELEPSDGTRDG